MGPHGMWSSCSNSYLNLDHSIWRAWSNIGVSEIWEYIYIYFLKKQIWEYLDGQIERTKPIKVVYHAGTWHMSFTHHT